MFLQFPTLPLFLFASSPIQGLSISLPKHALGSSPLSTARNTSISNPLPDPYQIPHTDLALYFPEPHLTPTRRLLNPWDVMTTLLSANDWLISEINAHGDKWVPASPDKLEFLGDTFRVVIECEEDPLRVEPSTLQYTDVIGVLRGLQTKMSWEGYVEREAEIQDSGVEDLFGTGTVMNFDSEDGSKGVE